MYHIKILNDKRRTYTYRKKLYDMGFAFNKGGKFYELYTDDECAIVKYQAFCKAHKLKISVANSQYKRNAKYRENYFSKHMDDKIHICAYCGRRVKKEGITIDHIFPVDKTSKNVMLQKIMRKVGILDINSEKNLCVAHQRCNSRKGSKTGIWIWKGFLGKSKGLWVIRWGVRLSIGMLFLVIWLHVLKEYVLAFW